MSKKLIDCYKEWMGTGIMTDRIDSYGMGGLCNTLPKEYLNTLDLLRPIEGGFLYWANECKNNNYWDKHIYNFNKTRQTIVLLICAMHDEL